MALPKHLHCKRTNSTKAGSSNDLCSLHRRQWDNANVEENTVTKLHMKSVEEVEPQKGTTRLILCK